MNAFILGLGLIMSWPPGPEAEIIDGTVIEVSEDGQVFRLLVTVPSPDTAVVVYPALGIRTMYRGKAYNQHGISPPGRTVSGLVLDFTGGVLPEYTTQDANWTRLNDGADLLVVYRPATPWVSAWRGPGDPRGPEYVIYKSGLDFNGDGLHNLSDLSFVGGMGTEVILALFEVYGSPAVYEWRAP